MSNVALIFSGQGAQEVGMGKELADAYPVTFKRLSAAANDLGIDLLSVCFDGPEETLTRTEYAQPGIFFVSWLALELLKEKIPNLEFGATAGLSLGEFTALAAAGALAFEDGLKIVHQRGRFMQEACEETQGAMAAILGLDRATVLAICEENDVELANLNCPGQLVISGEGEKIHRACERAKALKAKRAKPLDVAGAYHSRLMRGAAGKLEQAIEHVALQAPNVEVIANVTAEPYRDPAHIRSTLVKQVTSPVLWEDSIRRLIARGFTRFIELGPGTTLSGFMKRIDRSVESLHVADSASLESTVRALTNP